MSICNTFTWFSPNFYCCFYYFHHWCYWEQQKRQSCRWFQLTATLIKQMFAKQNEFYSLLWFFWSFYNFTENKLLTQKNSYKKTDLCKSVIKFRLLGYKFRSSIVIRRNMRSHTAFSVNWPFIANVVRSYWQNL